LSKKYFCLPLGVAGIWFGDDKTILKGGKEGVGIKPVNLLAISATRKYQIVDVEWRCKSFREARIVPLSQRGWEVIESSGSKGAGLAASLLKKEMMSLCAVLVAHRVGL
jgi:hypothetical protein